MLSVAEALAVVIEQARPLAARELSLSDALDLQLAEAICSDIDSPPHDRAIVDGYALCAADLVSGQAELKLLEEVTAGRMPSQRVTSGTTTRIMTGAPIPPGADAVVMIERSEAGKRDGITWVRLREPQIKIGQNISRQGSSIRRGELIFAPGRRLRPCDIGVLAEIGRATIHARPVPRVAILATGDELVMPHEVPRPGQIRNSNESLLTALVQRAGATPLPLGIARDDRETLQEKILAGLTADLLLLSGGVSAGVLDLVPSVLADLGVQQLFHKLRLKPGKPLWFGVAEQSGQRTLVFGLPGNPVSGLVCFRLFVAAAIERLFGRETAATVTTRPAQLTAAFVHRGDRPTYFPAKIAADPASEHVHLATPLDWRGSGDLRTLIDADALLAFPPGDQEYPAGSRAEFLWL